MISPDQWRELARDWENSCHQREEHGIKMTPDQIIDELGALVDQAPAGLLAEDPDPQKLGIQGLRRAFEILDTRRSQKS